MSVSRYEEARKEAYKALHHAICESNYFVNDEYIVVVQNITNDYNVDFVKTIEGDWADEVFEQSFDATVDCAFSHKGNVYYVILAKVYQCGKVVILEKRRICVDKRK